jgi:hypothetical protein
MLNKIDNIHRRRAIVIIIATILFFSAKGFLSSIIGVGFVIEREVIGINGSERIVLFESDTEGVKVEDNYLRMLSPESSKNLQIGEPIKTELKKKYPEIEYRVQMKICTEDTVRDYKVKREDFNTLSIGTIARFEVYLSDRTSIDRIIET